LVDSGFQLKGGRYAVDLGPVDIARPGTYSYNLKGLPQAEFVVGIEIEEAAPNRDARPNHKAEVRLDLTRTGPEIIVAEQGSLEAWTWSYILDDTKSFLYRRGEERDTPLLDGRIKSVRVGEKASGGWGSYFAADTSTNYRLTFQVLASEIPERPTRLILKSVDK
jgi:hypothetical protein